MKFLITLLFYCLIVGEEIYIDLITTNDMHGFIKEQKAYFMNPQYPPTIIGGSGYYKYISDVKQNQSKEDMLILDAGNFFQGSNFGMHDGGKSVIEWMNKLEYDAMVLGQYDFILGASNLNEAIETEEIVISEKPGDTLKKWRNIFKLSQKNLASLLNVKPSVVCDFEKGRRASPGIGTVRKFVEAMVEYDKAQGGKIVSSMFAKDNNNAVYDIREFNTGTAIDKLIKEIDGEILSGNGDILERPIYGYTIVDSLKAITTFNVFGDLYGWSNERAIFFSGVHFGRSPMIAIRAHPVKPRVVIYIKPKAIDKLATKLAEMERIVLVKTELDEDEIVRILKKFN